MRGDTDANNGRFDAVTSAHEIVGGLTPPSGVPRKVLRHRERFHKSSARSAHLALPGADALAPAVKRLFFDFGH